MTPLSGPALSIAIRIGVRTSPDEAIRRIRESVGGRPATTAGDDDGWRVTGGVSDGGDVELSLREGNWAARRKSWNVVVRGWFEVERAGLIFVGTADVADEQALQRIVALLRVGAATPLALALGLALARPDGVAAASIAFGAALAGVSLVGITRLVADGERQALADAGRLISLLERDLG